MWVVQAKTDHQLNKELFKKRNYDEMSDAKPA